LSWCDKLASTPTIGFRFSPHFASGDALLDAFSPLLDPLVDGNKVRFTIEQHVSQAITFNTEDGFKYQADQWKLSVGFNHRPKIKLISGGPPVMELLSRPMPYTKLVPTVADKLVAAALLLPNIQKRTVERVGIVAVTPVAEDDIPPGIARFIRYVGRPWKHLDHFSLSITADLEETSTSSDRCIHTITKPEDPDQLMTLQFDWQRLFKSGRPTTDKIMRELLDNAEKTSSKYFEDLAEGSMFDEDLIGTKAKS
jgi:hypothetical protein